MAKKRINFTLLFCLLCILFLAYIKISKSMFNTSLLYTFNTAVLSNQEKKSYFFLGYITISFSMQPQNITIVVNQLSLYYFHLFSKKIVYVSDLKLVIGINSTHNFIISAWWGFFAPSTRVINLIFTEECSLKFDSPSMCFAEVLCFYGSWTTYCCISLILWLLIPLFSAVK